MSLTAPGLVELYRRRARHYDVSANLYYLIGFREYAYRKSAIAALGLTRGDSVVEIGCGTGLNFPFLQAAIGNTGRIIGVDVTDTMLERAQDRVDAHRWPNVELVHADASTYAFPSGIHAVLSTFAISLIPEYDRVIMHGAVALAPRGRMVILDLKEPTHAPAWMVRVGVLLTRPFGVTADLTKRHPWESMQRHLQFVSMTELYGGFAYIAKGEAR